MERVECFFHIVFPRSSKVKCLRRQPSLSADYTITESKAEEIQVPVKNGFLHIPDEENNGNDPRIGFDSEPWRLGRLGRLLDEFQEKQFEQFRAPQTGKSNQPQNLTEVSEEPQRSCFTVYVGCLREQPAPTVDDLRGFFTRHGINVAGVRVIMDTSKRGRKKCRSRGHGFVDFDDSKSFEGALALRNEQAVGLAEGDGKLQIQTAKSGPP